MNLKFRRPSKVAMKALCKIAMEPSKAKKTLQETEKRILELTGHRMAKLVNSGNAALLTVMSRLPPPFLYPIKVLARFQTNPKVLNKETDTLKLALDL